MPSRHVRKGLPAMVQASGSEDTTRESSQEADVNILKEAQDIISKNQSRRDAKRQAIEVEHEKRVKEVRAKIDTHFSSRKSRVSESQNALWDRLEALNKKRQLLEGKILNSMKTIEKHTGNIASELAAMYDGRIEEIENYE